jgi:hypothetical protein
MKLLKFAAVLAVSAFAPFAAHAATSVCPVLAGGNSGGFGVASTYIADSGGTNGGCNVLITFNSNGSITTTNPNAAGFYDTGGDDNLIGIINNTSSPINSINLSSSSQFIFDFESDGVCGGPGYTVSGGGAACANSDASGYGPASVTFTNIAANDMSGTVNFAGGIAGNGGTAFFSLEGPVDLNLRVTGGSTPEPSSLVLLGTGVLGFAGMIRRKLMA